MGQKSSLLAGHLSQTCFIAQQVAEKSLKALALHLEYDIVRGHSVKELANKLGINGQIEEMAKKLETRAKQAYFFSSFATDTLSSHSDIDLLIVKDTKTNFVERPLEFTDLLDIIPTIDILVYTSEEFENLTTNPTARLWQDITKNMIRIF